MGPVLLQHEVISQIEAIDAEILQLVSLVGHLTSHGHRTILYTLLNFALLRVDLREVEECLSVARLQDI